MSAPLEDITVIEIDSFMAAPGAGAIMADMGARVIKIEPPGGDPMRGGTRKPKGDAFNEAQRHYDYMFDVDNRGKRSVAIALDQPEGPRAVHALVSKAHVFMCNLLPQRQQKYRLDAETLLAINPKLVHATLTGYGTTGPEAQRPGFDVTSFFARSGLYDAMREGKDGIVPMARPAQGDHTTSLALFGGIMAALRHAERTGEGQVLETSLFETAIWTQASDYATTANDAAPVTRRARDEQLSPMANRYPCGDGLWIVLNVMNLSQWPTFCRIIGRDDWAEDEHLADARNRLRAMKELVPAIDAALSSKGRDEWGRLFDAAGIIWGPVQQLHEVARDPQAEAIGVFPKLHNDAIGDYRTVNPPMRFKNADVRPRGPAPHIGEHSREVLIEAGFTDAEVDALVEARTVREGS